jgi:glycosyltransferase involved in cell wall biosynthesis
VRVLLLSPQCVVPEYRKRLELVGRQVTLLALAPREFVDVFANGGGPSKPAARSYDLRELPVPFRSRSGTRCVLNIPGSLWRKFGPDIVHVEQEIWSLAVFEALIYRRLYSPRAAFVISTWENLPRPGLKGRVLDAIFDFVVPRAKLILSVNRDGEAIVKAHGARHTRVIPQIGVDPAKFRPIPGDERRALRAKLGLPPDAFVAVYAGRLVHEKGIRDLLAAWARLPRRDGSLLVFVGNGPLRSELPSSDPSIRTLPPVPRGETAPYFQIADVSVLPSRTTVTWKEQFGIALIESMSCRVPVIGSSSGAIPEVLGEGGIVFPEGNVEALADALQRMRDNAAERERIAGLAEERVRSRFSNEAVARGMLDAYRSVTGPPADP